MGFIDFFINFLQYFRDFQVIIAQEIVYRITSPNIMKNKSITLLKTVIKSRKTKLSHCWKLL
jgi:hypothetical protein